MRTAVIRTAVQGHSASSSPCHCGASNKSCSCRLDEVDSRRGNREMTDFHENAQHLAIDRQEDQRNIMQHPRYLSPGSISPVAGMFSVFSSIFRPDFLDMVFLDGDHRYESVMDDIKVQCRFVKGNIYKINRKIQNPCENW